MDSFIAARLVGPKRARRDGLEISRGPSDGTFPTPRKPLPERRKSFPTSRKSFPEVRLHFPTPRKPFPDSARAFRHLGNHFRKPACAFRHLGNHFRTPFELSNASETISGFRLSFPTSRKPFPEVRSSFPTSRKPAPAAGMSSRSWKQEKCPLP